MRHDEELAFSDHDFAIAQPHGQRAVQDHEHFVFRVVVVPDEFALQLDELDVLAVQVAHDARVPIIVDARELFGEINLVHFAVSDGLPGTGVYSSTTRPVQSPAAWRACR